MSGRAYDVVYPTDLVYEKDCFRLCGDAHCCHYDRYKRLGPAEGRGTTKIPLLAGEYDWLREHGMLDQYASHDLERTVFAGREADYTFDVLAVPAPDGCPCDHDRRPTLCRLYPVLPRFDVARGLVGLDLRFGIFEEIEDLAGTPRACRVEATSFAQVDLLVRVCAAIAEDRQCLFSLMAYAAMKDRFRARVLHVMEECAVPAGQAVGLLMRTGNFVDRAAVAADLDTLLARFREIDGASFRPA